MNNKKWIICDICKGSGKALDYARYNFPIISYLKYTCPYCKNNGGYYVNIKGENNEQR